jgi:hypothetical protein
MKVTTAVVVAAGVVLALGVLSSCSEEEQPTDQRARITFQQDGVISLQWLSVSLSDGETTWSFGPANFKPDPNDSTLFIGPQVQTRSSGDLRLTYSLVREDDFVFSNGTLKAPLSPSWNWQFDILYSVMQPPITGDDYFKTSMFEVHDQAHSGFVFVIWRGRGP